jgi:hypothetical protein
MLGPRIERFHILIEGFRWQLIAKALLSYPPGEAGQKSL